MLFNILFVIEVVLGVALIALVFFQPSKTGDAGGAFSGGGQNQVVASSYDFLTKFTFVLGLLFLLCGLAVAYVGKKEAESLNKIEVVVPVGDLPTHSVVPSKNAEKPADVAIDSAASQAPVVQGAAESTEKSPSLPVTQPVTPTPVTP
jgi:protein translocase SecG subunit